MDDRQLEWKVISSEELVRTPVFDVARQSEAAASGMRGDYIAIAAPDWAMVIAEYRGCFVIVRQWRHAAQCMTAEFPGGVVDEGEDPAAAAVRELSEETGFKVGRLTHLGSVSPNPALFKNRFHVYLALDLTPTGEQELDDDELLTYRLVPIGEVIAAYGRGEYTHGLMGTAIALYLQHEYRKNQEDPRPSGTQA